MVAAMSDGRGRSDEPVLFTGKFRNAFLKKCGNAFLEVARPPGLELALGLEI